MKLQVEYTGQLRTDMGRSSECLELSDGATASDLLIHLAKRGGELAKRHLLNASGNLQPSLLVAINGTAQLSRRLNSILLHDGDSVVLLPPIAGG